MKEIQLTQGKVAIVDDKNFELLNNNKWYTTKSKNVYYVMRAITIQSQCKQKNIRYKHRIIMLHRVVMENKLGRKLKPNEYIDHIDRNGLDNRECNLRLCNCSKNGANSIKPKTYCNKPTSSIYKGVNWRKDCKKWRAYIKINTKQINLGCFNNEIQAAKVYDEAALKYFGEFARVNFGGN